MAQKQIINYFRKVDQKFLTQLNSSQKVEAIEQFQNILITEMPKVSIFLNRMHKVVTNRAQIQRHKQHQTKQIASSLRSRIQKHFQKRDNMQIQKLKNYKNLDRVWQGKMLQIKSQAKRQLKKNLQKYKQISKQIEQFWKKKKSLSPSNSRSFSPKSQTKNTNYFDMKKIKSKQQHGQFKFVTQVRTSNQRMRYKTSPRSEAQLPIIVNLDKSNLKENIRGKLFKQKMKRISSSNLNNQAIKSKQQWKVKQQSYFQNAMEKIDKILNIRIRVRQNLKGQIKKAKNSRLLKESVIKDKRYFSSSEFQHPSPHDLRHKNFEKRNIIQRQSIASISGRQSNVQLRRKEHNSQEFKNREYTFLEQKEKQKRSKFHRMVRDAINIYRFQALRQKQ